MLSKVSSLSNTNFLASSFPVYARICMYKKLNSTALLPNCRILEKEGLKKVGNDYLGIIATDTKIIWNRPSNIFIIHFHMHEDKLQLTIKSTFKNMGNLDLISDFRIMWLSVAGKKKKRFRCHSYISRLTLITQSFWFQFNRPIDCFFSFTFKTQLHKVYRIIPQW